MDVTGVKPIFKRVLVIDDNEIDLYVAENSIQKYRFAEEVILRESARDALNYLRSLEDTPDELPNLIFLDISMPEMDGFGFLDEFEKLPESVRKRTMIMMLSSSLNDRDHERAAKNSSISKFVVKPLNREKLSKITF